MSEDHTPSQGPEIRKISTPFFLKKKKKKGLMPSMGGLQGSHQIRVRLSCQPALPARYGGGGCLCKCLLGATAGSEPFLALWHWLAVLLHDLGGTVLTSLALFPRENASHLQHGNCPLLFQPARFCSQMPPLQGWVGSPEVCLE